MKTPPIEDRLAINDLFVRYMRSIDDGGSSWAWAR